MMHFQRHIISYYILYYKIYNIYNILLTTFSVLLYIRFNQLFKLL